MAVQLVVVGAGGFGRETLDVIEAINRMGPGPQFDVIGVADDSPSNLNKNRLSDRGYPLLGSIAETLARRTISCYALAIGNPTTRRLVADRFEHASWRAATLVHPNAVIGSVTQVGEGSIICGGVQVSTNVRLGRHVHLNPNATIGHDADLDDFVSVNPGAILSGEVLIGAGALVGAGAVVLQGLAVGPESTIGANSCVTRDMPGGVVAKGTPARWT